MSYIILSGKRLNTFFQYKKWFALGSLLSIILKVLVMAIRQQKEMKGIQIGKEEVKLYLFEDDMMLYTENPKNLAKNC